MFAEDSLVRLGGSGKINWKSVASEDAPVKADSHRPAATRSRRKRKITGKKCEEAISRRSAATGEKKKKSEKKKKKAQRNPIVQNRTTEREGAHTPAGEHAATTLARRPRYMGGRRAVSASQY